MMQGESRVVQIPDLRLYARGRNEWPVVTETQDLVPAEPIHRQLGIPAGSKVLFFAGAQGDWAHALARHCEVHYTDSSKDMVEYARSRFAGIVKSFRRSEATKWPVNNRYDYVVSFEPIPLWTRLPVIALRALAHAKGMRIAAGIDSFTPFIITLRGLEALENLYGATVERKHEVVKCKDKVLKFFPRTTLVWKLDSSERAKQLAQLDLKVIAAMQGRKTISLEQLKRKLEKRGIPLAEGEIEHSLNRIHALSTIDAATRTNTREVEVTR